MTKIALPVALFLTTACMSETDAQAIPGQTIPDQAIPDIDFTGVGKPTETVTTQYGTFDIYDPRQDPELLEMVGTLWVAESVPDKATMMAHWQAIERAQQLRLLDCLRAGAAAEPYAFRYTLESTIAENCEDIAFGQPELTTCESAHSRMEQITPVIAIAAAFESGSYMVIDPNVKASSSLDDVLDTLFKGSCEMAVPTMRDDMGNGAKKGDTQDG